MAIALTRYTLGGSKPVVIWDPCCQGRIYMVHFYNSAGAPVGSPDDRLHFVWTPQTERGACPTTFPNTEDNDNIGDRVDAHGLKNGKCGAALKGSDNPVWGIGVFGSPAGQVSVPIPSYHIDLACGFAAPCAGSLALFGGVAAPGTDVYVAVSHRLIQPGEKWPRWRYTQWIEAGATVFAPKGATGISASTANQTITAFYASGNRTFPLPSSGQAWPLRGAGAVKPDAAGEFSWELAL